MQADAGLQERAEVYLKSLFVDAQPALTMDFDGATAFGELGIDSFRVLKIIKRLESDFGALPKTLLFEYFNVEALAGWLVQRHANTLVRIFGAAGDVVSVPATPTAASLPPAVMPARPKALEPRHDATPSKAEEKPQPVLATVTPAASASTPLLLLERDIDQHPGLRECVETL